MGKIGKNVLENLTQSMYDDSRIIYREYIQNSCDQIDIAMKNNSFMDEELEIIITIDEKKRNIFIRDNANGISKEDIVHKLEDIADSDKKQGENKGFRGIGRLGGIGYCRELRFVTSFLGESEETTMIWDAKKLRDIFGDADNHLSAEAVLEEVISYQVKNVSAESHYFEVQLLGVNEENNQLLDYNDIKQYISEVAPVNFKSTFIYKTKIEKFLDENKDEIQPMHCYKIGIRKQNGEINYVHKDYPTKIYKILGNKKIGVDDVRDVHTDIIRDDQGNAIAWIWFAISCFKGAINDKGNPWKGLRLRQFNIQIGTKTTLNKLFSEPRGNSYFLGEVHTLSKKFRPNARRDYFTETPEVKDFESALESYFKELTRLYKYASEINSSYEKIKKAETLELDFQKKAQKGFASAEDKAKIEVERAEANEKAKEAVKKLDKFKEKTSSENQTPLSQLVKAIEKDRKTNVDEIKKKVEVKQKKECDLDTQKDKTNKSEKTKLLVDDLSTYDKKTRKLISRIYDVIQKNIIKEEADALVEKIQEELKRK